MAAEPRIILGRFGWYRVVVDDLTVHLTVRLDRMPTGRIAIAEVVVARFPGVSTEALRALPVGRVEAWANGRGLEHVLNEITIREAATDEEREEIDAKERSEANKWARSGWLPEAVAAQESMMAQIAQAGATEAFDKGQEAIGLSPWGKPEVLRSRVRNLRLRVPEGQPKPDSFYREVARLYGEVALNTSQPAVAIAEANSVPISRVHGWIKEARRRGLLAPGERQGRRT